MDQQRFSGPELSDLLDRVVAEHGETAAISAVHRVRSGGLAGFFCKEEFEIVVEADEPPVADESLAADESVRSTEAPDLPISAADLPTGPAAEPSTPVEAAPARLAYRYADRDLTPIADEVTEPEPEPELDLEPEPELDLEPEPEPDVEPGPEPEPVRPVFAGPTPPDGDRFLALLERRLDETSSTEAVLSLRRMEVTRPAAPPVAIPVAPAPGALPAEVGSDGGAGPADEPPDAGPGTGPDGWLDRSPLADAPRLPPFWRQLQQAGDELRTFLPAGSPVTAVVGPLSLATSVVRRLRSTGTLASADVVVLTDRAGIVSEPAWEIVRNANRLVDAVTHRAPGLPEAAPLVVIIDVPDDLPQWVLALQHRLRGAGVGLFRYPVAGQPSSSTLERFRQGGDVPYAIDLVSRVAPGVVLDLLADRHPVVSVAGSDLSPELLVALRRHGAIGGDRWPAHDGSLTDG